MKIRIEKPKNLSASQNVIWNAVTKSKHSIASIANCSGYSVQGIKNWMRGIYEPKQFDFESLIEAIELLESKPPKSINWEAKKGELIQLKIKGLSNKQIAEQLETTRLAVEKASKRLLAA